MLVVYGIMKLGISRGMTAISPFLEAAQKHTREGHLSIKDNGGDPSL